MKGIERGSGLDILREINARVSSLSSSPTQAVLRGPATVVIDEPRRYSAIFLDPGSEQAIPAEDITAGVYSIFRIRGGVKTTIVSEQPCSKEDGRTYFEYAFPDGTWAVGDGVYIEMTGVAVVVDDVTTAIPLLVADSRVVDWADVRDNTQAIRDEVEHATHGLEAIRNSIGSIDTVAVGTSLGIAKELVTDYALEHLATPSIWSKLDAGHSNTFEAVTSTFRSAPNSLRVNSAAQDNGVQFHLLKNVVSKARFIARAWIYHEAGSSQQFEVGVNTSDGFYSSVGAIPSGAWTMIEHEFTTGDTTAESDAYFRVIRKGNSPTTLTFYVDDMMLRQLDEPDVYKDIREVAVLATTNRNHLVDEDYGLSAIKSAVGNAVTTAGYAYTAAGSASVTATAIKAQTDKLNFTGTDVKATLDGEQVVVSTNNDKSGYSISGTKTTLDALNDISSAGVTAACTSSLNAAINSAPTAKSLRDILHKNTSYTFDKSTDSLEAIRDYIQDVVFANVERFPSRIGASTSLSGGSEVNLIDYSSAAAGIREFQGWIDLSELADTRSITIRVYLRLKSGGTLRTVSTQVFTGSANAGVIPVPAIFPVGGTSYKVVMPAMLNNFGFKVTAQQTVLGGGYLTIDHEWYLRSQA